MNFFDLNDDVKLIITKHLTIDCKMNKIFITKPDDDLQKIFIIWWSTRDENRYLKNKLTTTLNFLKKNIIKLVWANIIMIQGKN